jgi:hypothetical protein
VPLPNIEDSLAEIQYAKDVSALKGLYYDVAGVCLPRQLAALLQIVAVDHLFYGSDYSYYKMEFDIGALLSET